MIAQSAAACRKRVVGRHDHPPFAGRDRLCGLEAQRAYAPDGAGTAAPVPGESSLRGIFDHFESPSDAAMAIASMSATLP